MSKWMGSLFLKLWSTQPWVFWSCPIPLKLIPSHHGIPCRRDFSGRLSKEVGTFLGFCTGRDLAVASFGVSLLAEGCSHTFCTSVPRKQPTWPTWTPLVSLWFVSDVSFYLRRQQHRAMTGSIYGHPMVIGLETQWIWFKSKPLKIGALYGDNSQFLFLFSLCQSFLERRYPIF